MSAANLAKSLNRGVDLRGRLLQDTSGKREGFRLRDFQVDIANRTAICPADRVALRFVPAKLNPRNLVAFHVFFGKQCQTCPFFGPDTCTDKLRGRHLGVSIHHDLIQARRQEEQMASFDQEMRIRAGAESVISELVRGYGARRARFRGQRKNALQVAFIGAAVNLKRLAWVAFCPYLSFTQPFIISPVSSSLYFNRVDFVRSTLSDEFGHTRLDGIVPLATRVTELNIERLHVTIGHLNLGEVLCHRREHVWTVSDLDLAACRNYPLPSMKMITTQS